MDIITVLRQAALKASPREACGVIVNDEVVECKNISEDSKNFILSPDDYLKASLKGAITKIWHTHPHTSSQPSLADKASCNRNQVPWLIYSLVDDSLYELQPEITDAPLLKRPFVWGVFDCWTLIRDYYKQKLGIVFPPIPPYEERFWEKGLNYYLDWYKMGDLEIVLPPARAHDILLMSLHSDVPNHGAVLLPSGKVLHHLQGQLSCESIYGNYWRRATSHVLRHRSML